jgi:hypothetical protein
VRLPLRRAQRKYHRAQADRLAGQILRNLHDTPEDVEGRDALYVRRYRHFDRLDALA